MGGRQNARKYLQMAQSYVKQQIQATDNSLLDCFCLISVLLLQPIFDVRHLPSILSYICQTLGSLWPHNARGVRSQQHVSLPGGLGARITSTMTIRSIRGVERYYWRFLLSKSQEPFVPRITPTTSPLIKPYLGGEYPTERGVPYWVGSILLSVLKHLTLFVSFQA